MKFSFIVLLLLSVSATFCLAVQTGEQPGLKARFGERGLNFGKDLVLDFVKNRLNSVPIPDVSGDSPLTYSLTNIEIVSFDLTQSTLETSAPNLFIPNVVDASVAVSATWEASRVVDLGIFSFTLQGAGNLTASASGVNLRQEIGLGRNSNDNPAFSIGSCTASIGNIEADLGDASFDALLKTFDEFVETELSNRLCPALKNLLEKQAAKLTERYDLIFSLTSQLGVDLGLVCDPEASEDNLLFSLRGRCFPRNNPSLSFPFSAPVMPPLSSTSQMVRLGINHYVLDTLLYSLWKEDLLDHEISASQISAVIDQTLTAADVATLLQKFSLHGNKPLHFLLRFVDLPDVHFDSDGITVYAHYEVAAGVLTDEEFQDVYTAAAVINATASMNVLEGRLFGRIENLEVRVTQAGEFPVELVNKLIEDNLPDQILPVLNNLAKTGYEIPDYMGYTLENTSVETKENALEIGTDISRVK
ncbi:bactericidal permeability-increasing protein-like [Clavelina lepadiformis]|uniref:bactericidal permeability-increasing protein-like n=1 Tax=Clavelina lepadiformis TaxID=159417 RepID=UPI0040412781